MKSRILRWFVGGLGALFILSSLAITLVEARQFQKQPVVFPQGSEIAGVPVEGLNETEATARLQAVYSQPLILEIGEAKVHAKPEELGFIIDIEDMVATASGELRSGSFWDYLWGNNNPEAVTVPLSAAVDENATREYLNREISPRYTTPGRAVTPILNTTNFLPAVPGSSLDVDKAIADIRTALVSPEIQQVTLQTLSETDQAKNQQMLQAFLEHNIRWIGFEDLVDVYLESMQTGDILHFAVDNGTEVRGDIAFTAASTIKIPIMISVLRRTEYPTPDEVKNLLERMIVFSENPPADTLMSNYLDAVRGPLVVSEDLEALGMQNTFLAGYFYLGAPVLQVYETPANTREDVYLDPDIYNQTVPGEAGQLLSAIYRCAENGTGLLTETFPGEISQSECQLMMDILFANKIGLLIEAGLPPEAAAAHKHGWVQELDGLLHSMSDVAIVSTPGGDYVLTIFIYDPERLNFDQGNRLLARLSQTVYNFFNIENQAYWWFD